MKYLVVCAVFVFTFFVLSPLSADVVPSDSIDLTELSIEELMNIEITSVSKKVEKLSGASAAVYVITKDEIKRSGAASLPELFRLVPGVQVGRTDSSKWWIGIRGFNELYSNKLLVLVDGRSVYTPLYSGVYWNIQDLVLDDIDRIEIVRGPGATMWGSNAVSGIINIVTKNSKDTGGLLISENVGAGEEKTIHALRYGRKIGEKGSVRVYAKDSRFEGFEQSPYGAASNDWDQRGVGFRADWKTADDSSLTLQGDSIAGHQSGTYLATSFIPPYYEILEPEIEENAQNMLFRWESPSTEEGSSSLQLYYNRFNRKQVIVSEVTLDIWDLDFQRIDNTGKNKKVWGFGYRLSNDNLEEIGRMWFDPGVRTDNLFSAFYQEDIQLRPDRSKLTAGIKLEHNDYTGLEIQPSIRACCTPADNQTIWASVSRAVRTPSRVESGINAYYYTMLAPDTNPILFFMTGNSEYKAEELTAYEVGYRIQPAQTLSFDVTGFYNVYKNIRTIEPQPMVYSDTPFPHYELDMLFDNKGSAVGRGAEALINWRASDKWFLTASGSWLAMSTETAPDSLDDTVHFFATVSPKYQYSLRSYADLSDKLAFNALAYWVGPTQSHGIGFDALDVPAYTRLDLNLIWKPNRNMDVSIGARNAFSSGHLETGTIFGELPTYIEPSYYAKATWRN